MVELEVDLFEPELDACVAAGDSQRSRSAKWSGDRARHDLVGGRPFSIDTAGRRRRRTRPDMAGVFSGNNDEVLSDASHHAAARPQHAAVPRSAK